MSGSTDFLQQLGDLTERLPAGLKVELKISREVVPHIPPPPQAIYTNTITPHPPVIQYPAAAIAPSFFPLTMAALPATTQSNPATIAPAAQATLTVGSTSVNSIPIRIPKINFPKVNFPKEIELNTGAIVKLVLVAGLVGGAWSYLNAAKKQPQATVPQQQSQKKTEAKANNPNFPYGTKAKLEYFTKGEQLWRGSKIDNWSIVSDYDDPRPGGRLHYAVDVNTPTGTVLFMPFDGTVEETSDTACGIGVILTFDGIDPDYYVVICHLDKRLKLGKVKAGQPIAESGNTGIGTGPHSHFALRERQPKGKKKKYFVPTREILTQILPRNKINRSFVL